MSEKRFFNFVPEIQPRVFDDHFVYANGAEHGSGILAARESSDPRNFDRISVLNSFFGLGRSEYFHAGLRHRSGILRIESRPACSVFDSLARKIKNRSTLWAPRFFMVETVGVEPTSESDPPPSSTCLSSALD